MVYFLGRDVKVAMTTEHEAFGIKFASNTLDIRGTASNALADDDAIPPRPIGLKEAGTAGVAEVSTITCVQADETTYESTSSSSGKFIKLFDPDGDEYVIHFSTAGGSGDVAPTEAGTATASLDVALTTSTGDTSDIATAIANAINADATFTKVFTATTTSARVNIANVQKGAATDIARGSGFADSVLTVNATGATAGVSASNIIKDITGVDITIGTVDEDIAYLGQRTALKAEIKNEINLVLTRKKGEGSSSSQSHELFSALFNEARCGLLHEDGTIDAEIGETDSKLSFDNNLTMPTATADGSNFGFRLHLQMKEGKEVMTLKNCCITEYGTTLNADGVTEETITFYANTKPVIGSTPNTTLTTQADF
tara:strand:+ start:422 stop:1531 length:1110 start_codon:yes stop_codon:yes gene_type:complete